MEKETFSKYNPLVLIIGLELCKWVDSQPPEKFEQIKEQNPSWFTK